MSRFSVRKLPELVPFGVVDAEGNKQPDVSAYLYSLVINGRSAYTIRGYAFGLAHFHSWLRARDLDLISVSPTDISSYIASYRGGLAAPRAATVNHRLSVISSYYGYLTSSRPGDARWASKKNPVPAVERTDRSIPMRKRPRRARADLRQRIPRHEHRQLQEIEIGALYDAAKNWRDRAILKLLEWCGQRIGDWSVIHGRHGILGLALQDIDHLARTVTVRVKGSRQIHIVPVGEAFWPVYDEYLHVERGRRDHSAAWISFRKGHGQPLSYATFETTLRELRRRSGVRCVSAHSYRHTFAQNLLDTTDNLALVQAFLAHSSPETTAATYVCVPTERLLRAVRDLEQRASHRRDAGEQQIYAFDYDLRSIAELEQLFAGRGYV
jgi:site-specific recombinase XerD